MRATLRSLGRFTWAALAVAVVVTSSSTGQTEAAEKKKSAISAAPAFVRVWTGYLSPNRSLRVVLRTSARKNSTIEMIPRTDAFRFGEYVEVPSGGWTLEISGADEAKQPPVTVPAQVAAGSFFTILIRESGAGVGAELIDDTIAGHVTGELTVRNLSPRLGNVQITAGPALSVRLASAESFLHVRGLPRNRIQVETSGADTSGETIQWSNEIDFSQILRATIVICPDPYGRLRPRVLVDGQNPVPKVE
jgi:hypothetical protein